MTNLLEEFFAKKYDLMSTNERIELQRKWLVFITSNKTKQANRLTSLHKAPFLLMPK